MILLEGENAYSPFRLDAIREGILSAAPELGAVDIEAKWVYALEMAERAFSIEELQRAQELLNATGQAPELEEGYGVWSFYVMPRKGTISPWSSKATDIFRNCSLTSILRVERGIRFTVRLPYGAKEKAARLGFAVAEAPRNLPPACFAALYDKMTEGVYTYIDDLFEVDEPKRGRVYDVLGKGVEAIREANEEIGLAISEEEMEYLAKSFAAAGRNPTDTELVMFGQVNSEHCRHKIFGAKFIIDGKEMPNSLFGMIKNTHEKRPKDTLSAYKDNSSVVKGYPTKIFSIDPKTNAYTFKEDQLDQLMKVETHNHPTAISPYPGAATGVGGEIRDEAATGTGSRTIAGICGFMVSNLRIPGFPQPWERVFADFPTRLATPLEIMTTGPIGGAAFGNEFGRPQLCGFFRTYEGEIAGELRGYHKPIMLAGGMGVIRHSQVQKKDVKTGSLIVQIGGPAMRIGLGGGAASSMMTGTNSEALDFNSVQRGNAEMQRRCQGVIDACSSLGAKNPILSIHDIGAGGLSNGCPELVEATGGKFELREVHNEERSMSPMEIWCCEAQERYVLALKPEARGFFESLCARERCPVAFIGSATGDGQLVLEDSYFNDKPIDMDIKVLLGKPPRMVRNVKRVKKNHEALNLEGIRPFEALMRILRLPAVADKTFLVTITDRSVTGRVARDQMVGKYQLPAADCAVATMGYATYEGQAMATGERSPVALLDGPASGRMAVTEAITNLAASYVGDISKIRLSANWMAPCGDAGEDAILYDTVQAVGLEFCPALGVSIPVGKDSCSMHTVWQDSNGEEKKQVAPLSLVVSSFAPIDDVRLTLTPDLKPDPEGEATFLIFADLSKGEKPLGATALAQVYSQLGDNHADCTDAKLLKDFFNATQRIVKNRLAMAYHDRSDGGIAVTLAEMAITGGRGIVAKLPEGDALIELFNEQPGAVLQVSESNVKKVLRYYHAAGVEAEVIGAVTKSSRKFEIFAGSRLAISTDITTLRRAWSETTYRMQALRDNPATAKEEYDNAFDEQDPGLNFHLTYDPDEIPNALFGEEALNAEPYEQMSLFDMDEANSGKSAKPKKPRVAILREQGVNGHIEMAAAFAAAGFSCQDVHMSDLILGKVNLADFSGLVACGGFSYGDVLGAGSGWARSILFNEKLKEMFKRFFERPDTFSLGVCNGCQMLSQLKDIIPGAEGWPKFVRNISEQFEARYSTIEIEPSPSIFFKGMEGSRLPIAVAHGEGRVWTNGWTPTIAAAHFVDGRGKPTVRYPWNPNGSLGGQTAFTTTDGRATIMMPHPERGFRACQLSYNPGVFKGEAGPWLRMFQNAYQFAISKI
ncbi:MAG: phosphoribosylformylglycinamidine synthase [Kiritimatiellae bacterium]|nr:phosphoribosylformylglycinamidine synthase [Kiritimatiellia bacterium]